MCGHFTCIVQLTNWSIQQKSSRSNNRNHAQTLIWMLLGVHTLSCKLYHYTKCLWLWSFIRPNVYGFGVSLGAAVLWKYMSDLQMIHERISRTFCRCRSFMGNEEFSYPHVHHLNRVWVLQAIHSLEIFKKTQAEEAFVLAGWAKIFWFGPSKGSQVLRCLSWCPILLAGLSPKAADCV